MVLRLRERLALAFLAAVLLPLAATALTVQAQIRSMYRFQREEGRERARRVAQVVLAEERRELNRSLEAVAVHPGLRLIDGPPDRARKVGERYELGRQLLAGTGLDHLSILDPEGRVVTCGHAPERFGFLDPAGRALGERPQAVELWRDGPETMQVTARPGPGDLLVVGGRRLDDVVLTRIARLTGLQASWSEPEGAAGTPDPADTLRLPAAEGLDLLLRSSDEAYRRLRSRVMGNVLGAAVAGGLAAILLGLWIGGRIARRVDRVASAAGRIAAGEARLAPIPREGRDEVGRMVRAFNRMTEDLARTQARAAEAERRAAWRGMARKVAHEIKNSLSPIRLSMENLLLARRMEGSEPDALLREGVATVLAEVDRLHLMASSFSEFARFPDAAPRPVDLAALIREVAASYVPRDRGIEVRLLLPEDAPRLLLDPFGMERLLVNLVTNALEAMGESGGELAIRLVLTADRLELTVEDRGTGFAPEILPVAFEPDITTRDRGTGLGLALVRRIARDHGGDACCENRPEGGARVTVTLPVRSAPPSEVPASSQTDQG